MTAALLDLPASNFVRAVPSPAAPSPICKSLPVHFAWDSMILGALKECPQKYKLAYLDGWTPKGGIGLITALTFGIAIHKALETFDKELIRNGGDHEIATRSAVRAGLVSLRGLRPIPKANARTPETLVRSIVWYTEQFRDDNLPTVALPSGEAAVELSFRIGLPITNPDGGPHYLCGHIDKLGRLGEGLYVVDHKHTRNAIDQDYFKKYSPDGQMSGYAIAASVLTGEPLAGVIIDAAQVGVNFTRFHRGFAHRPPGVLDEWLADTIEWIRQAEEWARKGRWPHNDKSCDKYGGCQFRKICAMSPESRMTFLKADFEQVQWNPLQSRGD